MRLLNELRRRRVFRTAALYIVSSWIVLQAASLALPAAEIPDAAIRYVWFALIIGFPVAVAFGWRYQITGEGVVRTASRADTAEDLGLKRPDYLILGALAAMLAIIAWRAMVEIETVERPFGVSVFGREIYANSIAILPLANLTGDPAQEFFVDGFHDALTSAFSQIGGFRVKSRTSTGAYRDVARPITQIARELGVARIIEGSVFRDGDEVQVTLSLVDAADDEQIWSQNYRRHVKDILGLQAEVAVTVADQVDVALSAEEAARFRNTRQVDPNIYESYLKGMFFVKRLNPDDIQHGLEYLHDATGLDPREPLAYAGIALGYNTIGHGVNAHAAFPKALAAAETALELDPWSGEAWAALGETQLYYNWDWQSAKTSLERAIQLSPSLDHAYAHYAYLVALSNRLDEAIEYSEKARELSPIDPLWAGFAAWMYMLAERWDEGIKTSEECLDFAPGFWLCQYALGQVYSATGRFDDALEIHLQIPDGTIFKPWATGISYALAGRREEAEAAIADMQRTGTPRDDLHIALTYSALGDPDKALQWFDIAFESRSDWLPWVNLPFAYGGAIEPLRKDSRFQEFVARLELPNATD